MLAFDNITWAKARVQGKLLLFYFKYVVTFFIATLIEKRSLFMKFAWQRTINKITGLCGHKILL